MEYNAATATDDLWAYLLAKYLYISNIKNKSENNNKKTNQKKPQIWKSKPIKYIPRVNSGWWDYR